MQTASDWRNWTDGGANAYAYRTLPGISKPALTGQVDAPLLQEVRPTPQTEFDTGRDRCLVPGLGWGQETARDDPGD